MKFRTLATNVTRLKTQLSNKSETERIINYVHVEDMHSCYIFSMFYHLVMDDNNKSTSDYMYSNWVNYIIKRDDGGKVVIDNRLSKPFQNTWKYLQAVAKQHLSEDTINDDGLVDVRPEVELWGIDAEVLRWNELRKEYPLLTKLEISEMVLAENIPGELGREHRRKFMS